MGSGGDSQFGVAYQQVSTTAPYLDIISAVEDALETNNIYMKLNLIVDCILLLQSSCKTLSHYMSDEQYQYNFNEKDDEIREIRNDLIGHPLDRLANNQKIGKALSIIHYFDTQFPMIKYERFSFTENEKNNYKLEELHFNIYDVSNASLKNTKSFFEKIKKDM